MIIGPEQIEIESLDELISFTWYKPKVQRSVPAGFSLAENLSNQKGGILYPKSMELDASKIDRLIKMRDNNQDWKFNFILERSENLTNILRDRIFVDFDRFITSRKGRHEFSRFMEKVANSFEKYKNDIIGSVDIVYTLYRIRFIEEKSNPDSRTPFYNHLLNTCLFALGLFIHSIKITDRKYNSDDIIKGAQVALFQGIGGANLVEVFAERSTEEQKIRYEEGNKNSSAGMASNLNLDSDVIDGIKYCNDYLQGKTDFIEKDDKANDYANIAVISRIFDSKITGLFGEASSPKDITDRLYVMSTNKELRKLFVDVLSKSIKLGFLFDFYYEIEKLNKACPYGKHGRPYPMTGFKSPVIFLCKGNLNTCRHYVSSSKSVTLFKKTGDLEVGSYGRCEWLSTDLIKFYDKFYEQIKEDTLSKLHSNDS